MADAEVRLEALEDELKLLKGEVKRTLVDLRAVVMREDSPLGEHPSFGRERTKDTVPQVAVEISQAASEGASTRSDGKVEALEQQLKAMQTSIEISTHLPSAPNQPVVNGPGAPMIWPGNNPAAQWPPGYQPPPGGSSPYPSAQPDYFPSAPQPDHFPSAPQPDHSNDTLPSQDEVSTGGDGEVRTNHGVRHRVDRGEGVGGPGGDQEENPLYTYQDERTRLQPSSRANQPGKGRGTVGPNDREQQDRRTSPEGKGKLIHRTQSPHPQVEGNGWDDQGQDEPYPVAGGVPGGLSLSVNLVTNLTRWVFLARNRVGQERLMDVLELYLYASPGSESLRELVVYICATGEDEPVCDEPVSGHDTADLIHQLHGIVVGGGVGHHKLATIASDGNSSEITQRHRANGG